MEGNFLSRYTNKVETWEQSIREDPINKSKYEYEMSQYIIQCMPYLELYTDELKKEVSTNNVFNCKETSGLQRKDIFNDYLIDVEKLNNIDRPIEKKREVCPTCPESATLISEELTYREEQETSEKIVNYSYKRENHFNEWLSQFQAQETTTIPTDVIEQLRNELKKIKVKVLDEITHARVRTLLKKLKLNKFYEHVPYITNIISGVKPPSMPQDLEERLRIMFKDIQKPFDDNCPPERKNFLSYSYVLYKFCELLSEDKYLKYFPLLKSKEKLYQQDVIWKKICEALHWEYIPTI
jgi:hypothetical protein